MEIQSRFEELQRQNRILRMLVVCVCFGVASIFCSGMSLRPDDTVSCKQIEIKGDDGSKFNIRVENGYLELGKSGCGGRCVFYFDKENTTVLEVQSKKHAVNLSAAKNGSSIRTFEQKNGKIVKSSPRTMMGSFVKTEKVPPFSTVELYDGKTEDTQRILITAEQAKGKNDSAFISLTDRYGDRQRYMGAK